MIATTKVCRIKFKHPLKAGEFGIASIPLRSFESEEKAREIFKVASSIYGVDREIVSVEILEKALS